VDRPAGAATPDQLVLPPQISIVESAALIQCFLGALGVIVVTFHDPGALS